MNYTKNLGNTSKISNTIGEIKYIHIKDKIDWYLDELVERSYKELSWMYYSGHAPTLSACRRVLRQRLMLPLKLQCMRTAAGESFSGGISFERKRKAGKLVIRATGGAPPLKATAACGCREQFKKLLRKLAATSRCSPH